MSIIANGIEPRQRVSRLAHFALFDAYDQGQVRTDLATFFGPNADIFLAAYDKMRAQQSNRRLTVRTWSWPVFLGSFTWFFYRKMYTYGAMLIFLPFVFSYLFGSVGGGMYVFFAISAKNHYVSQGLSRIYKADQLGLTGSERTDYLQRAGGVSPLAGTFAGLIYGLALILLVSALFLHHKTGNT
jgi:hypothetical protein